MKPTPDTAVERTVSRSVAMGSVPSGDVTWTVNGNVPDAPGAHLERHRAVRAVHGHDLRGTVGEVELRAREHDPDAERRGRGAADGQRHGCVARGERDRLSSRSAEEGGLLIDLGVDGLEVRGPAVGVEPHGTRDQQPPPSGVEQRVVFVDHRGEAGELLARADQRGAEAGRRRRGRLGGERAHHGMSVLVDSARDGAEVLVDGDGVEQRGGLETVEEHVEECRRWLPARRRPHDRAALDAGAVEVELRQIGEEVDGGEHVITGLGEVGDEAVVHERRALHGHAFDLERRRSSEGERQGGRSEQVLPQDQLVHAEVAKTGEGESVHGLVGDPGASVGSRGCQRGGEGIAPAAELGRQFVGESVVQHRGGVDVDIGPRDDLTRSDRSRSCSRSCRSSVDAVAVSAVRVSADGTIVRGTSG